MLLPDFTFYSYNNNTILVNSSTVNSRYTVVNIICSSLMFTISRDLLYQET